MNFYALCGLFFLTGKKNNYLLQAVFKSLQGFSLN
jgi:hypothetical protein